MSEQFKKMTIDDLDLEFEDESADKGDGSIQQDVDLVFGASDDDASTGGGEAKVASIDAARAKKSANTPAATKASPQSPPANAATTAANAASMQQLAQQIQLNTSQEVSKIVQQQIALMQQNFQNQITQLTQHIQSLQTKLAEVSNGNAQGGSSEGGDLGYEKKLAVSEFKGEYMSELLSEFKLTEYKVNQYLMKVHAKNPNFQQEILAVKKLLQEYQNKIKPKK